MKKKWIFIALLLVVLTAAAIPTAQAFMFTKSQTVTNTYVPAQVSCQVSETFNGTTKSALQVTNTGNTDVFIRVRLVSYWKDSKDNAVARQQENVTFTLGSGWVKYGDIYYYTTPVAPGTSTSDLLGSDITLKQEDGESLNANNKFTYHQALDIVAEAIQSRPDDAVERSWGVTVNASGNIS